MFYTYIHKKPDTGEVFYVGKCKNRRFESIHNRNRYWKNIVKKHGGFEAIIIEHFDDEKDALDAEIKLIASMRNAGIRLANIANGGEGSSGLKHTQESRALMSSKQKGRKLSDETKAKIGVKSLGRPKTRDEIEKSRLKRIGAKRTEEQRKRMSDGCFFPNIGCFSPFRLSPISDEARAKMRERRLGKKPWNVGLKGAYFQTDETREKVRVATLLSWEKRRRKKENDE